MEKIASSDAENGTGKLPEEVGGGVPINSLFTQVVLPGLSLRYILQALEDINPLNIFRKGNPANRPGFTPWKTPKPGESMARNFPALGMGAIALAFITYYSKNTYDDIRTLYADSVAYELDKKPNWYDMFFKSKNAALNVTARAYVTRTLMRSLAGASFLAPWHRLRHWQHAAPKYGANLNAGVGIMGGYLYAEGAIRELSFFDAQQALVRRAVNHADNATHEIIQPKDIERLLLLQRKHLDKNYRWPALDSPEGELQTILATRIAGLMNQAYGNAAKTEPADLTIGKFNFLIGFGLLDKDFPVSLAFVELANRSSDMKDVKAAAAAINHGQSPVEVFRAFGIDINPEVVAAAPAPATERLAGLTKPKILPRSLMECAIKNPAEPNYSLSS